MVIASSHKRITSALPYQQSYSHIDQYSTRRPGKNAKNNIVPINSYMAMYSNIVHMGGSWLITLFMSLQHRILRELRWWITSIEAHTELLQRARLLEDSQAAHLNSRTRHLSRALTSLLRYFSVDLSSLPAEVLGHFFKMRNYLIVLLFNLNAPFMLVNIYYMF